MCWPLPNQTVTRSSFAPTWTQTGEESEESKVSTVIRPRPHLTFKWKECVCNVVPSAFQSFWTTKRRSRLLAAVTTRSHCCPSAATLSMWTHPVLTFLGKHQHCPRNSDRCQIFWNIDTWTIDIARSHIDIWSLSLLMSCSARLLNALSSRTVSQVACGSQHSVALTKGTVKIWGENKLTQWIFFVVLWAGNNNKNCVWII